MQSCKKRLGARFSLVLVLGFLLVSCKPKERLGLPDKWDKESALLPQECQPLKPLLAKCTSVVGSDQEAKKVLAVLGEPLQNASKAKQDSICQDALLFWQAACGVTR
jgi:hypothetical protein